MRNFLSVVLALVIFSACKKETAATSITPARDVNIANAVVTGKGNLVFTDDATAKGIAKIYRQPDGKYVLGLENIDYKTVFDLHVYISTTPTFSSASLKLFSFKITDTDVYYPIQTGVAVETFKYVIIQKDASMPIASTVLN